MSHITTPSTIANAPKASQAMLENVNKTLGSVPNLFRITANSPAALQGFLDLRSALSGGELDPAIAERIALAVAQINGCDYCLAAHSFIACNQLGLNSAEIAANRNGTSSDAKARVAVEFAALITQKRGAASQADIDALLGAGFSEGEVVEIITHVALNTLSNYLNEALDTEVDFPAADRLAA